MRFLPATLLGFVLSLSIPDARAEAVKLDAVLSTSESISLAFKNDDRRFVTLLKREGTASGSGIFKGAQVVQLRATFVQGPEGKTRVVNAGTWEIIGGTGRFADQRGVGSLRIEFPSKTERRYIFEGDISPSP